MRGKKAVFLLLGLILALVAGVGIFQWANRGRVSDGYVLFAPLTSNTTYLIDNNGETVHQWESTSFPGNSVYLLENGHLLRTADPGTNGNETFDAGGAGGRIEEFDWDGNLVWQFDYSSSHYLSHHDIERLPNGNILIIAWEYRTAEEAIAAGRNPKLLKDGELWPDHIIEIEPSGSQAGRIVWEWHAWDHLVQDYDSTKANYGVVSEHPELIDINYVGENDSDGKADWMHTNSIDYNAELDQIVISVRSFCEIWVIDHSTTMEEAAGHTGGKSGKGGDILYRWGNPMAYRAGTVADRQLFYQHDAEWIANDLPGAGNILAYNNGLNRTGGKDYSTVDELVTPVDKNGAYRFAAGGKYGPEKPVWTYRANPPGSFYSRFISGSQRLANGNTLICSGANGRLFEVTQRGQTVWSFTNPYGTADSEGKVKNTVFRAERYAPDYPGLSGLNESSGQ